MAHAKIETNATSETAGIYMDIVFDLIELYDNGAYTKHQCVFTGSSCFYVMLLSGTPPARLKRTATTIKKNISQETGKVLDAMVKESIEMYSNQIKRN